ncbi:hypothetical protein J6590_048249 [Homalodisca vitripennis]|nr:hypothetical protein J6590_048249 [Homalodisca vitripennis]
MKGYDKRTRILYQNWRMILLNTFSAAGLPAGPARHDLGAGASRRSRLVRYSSWLVVRVGLGTWFVRVSPPPYGVHPRPLCLLCVYECCTMSTMDHSIPGPSGNASEATRIELQPENLDYVDVDDPVQRTVDDVSDEESDDGSSVNDADEDPDIYTTAPQWTITTSGMRPTQFTKFEHKTQCTIKVRSDEMRSRLTLLSAFGSAACAWEYMSDNARCCGVRRRLMTLMGQSIFCSDLWL